jgi:hypothetical protein
MKRISQDEVMLYRAALLGAKNVESDGPEYQRFYDLFDVPTPYEAGVAFSGHYGSVELSVVDWDVLSLLDVMSAATYLATDFSDLKASLDFRQKSMGPISEAHRDIIPAPVPPSWGRINRLVAIRTPVLEAELGRAPTLFELRDELLAVCMEWAYGRLSENEKGLPESRRLELQSSRLRKQGILSPLEDLEKLRLVIQYRITYRSSSPEAQEALRRGFSFFDEIHLEELSEIRKTAAVDVRVQGHRMGKDSLHCERIFGPEVLGTCTCGKYQDWPTVLRCERCGVLTGSSALRAETFATIRLAFDVENPITHRMTSLIPVIPPALRPVLIDGGDCSFDEIDRYYVRLLVLSSLAESPVWADDILGPSRTLRALTIKTVEDIGRLAR